MTDTAAPNAEVTSSEIAWGLSSVLPGASMSTPAEVVNRTEAIAAGLMGVIVVKTGSRRTPG